MTNTWSNERIIDFINEVHSHPILWNAETEVYKDRNAKKDTWAVVGEKFCISSDDAYKKFRSLRTYAKNEEKKKKNSSASGKPVKWFAYDSISFVLTQDTQNRRLCSENVTPEVIEAHYNFNNADQEEINPAEATDYMFTSTVSPKIRVANLSKHTDTYIDKARHFTSESNTKRRNEYAGFGEHIANKLSKYDNYTRALAEFKIMQILFDCDMGLYRNPALSVNTQSCDNSLDRAGGSTSHSQYSDMSSLHSPP